MNRSVTSARLSTASLVISLLAACATLFAFAATANAAPVQIGNFIYYTTADLCKLELTPETANRQTGETHTVTATVTSPGLPNPQLESVDTKSAWSACFYGEIAALTGAEVKFSVTGGPHAGVSGVVGLNSSGQASFSYPGTLAGTDTISASLDLPDLCYGYWIDLDRIEELPTLPSSCNYASTNQTPEYCFIGPAAVNQIDPCPTVTLTDTANVTWSTPPQVVAQADPTIAIAAYRRCVSHRFRISPSYNNGEVKTSTLFVDGKKVATKNGPGSFLVNGPKYKSGKHNFEVVTTFTNGKAASKFGSFSRCKIRTAARTVSPQFTG